MTILPYEQEVQRRMEAIDQAILSELDENGPMHRGQISRKLEIPRTTVYDHLASLLEEGLITKFPKPRNTRGRPLILYERVEART